MENITKGIKQKIKEERGAYTIMEAAIVFPVMFFVLFFIIFVGNMYYEQSKMDDCVMRYAIKGAQCCADPYLYDFVQTGSVPTSLKSVEIKPYRYIIGGMDDIEKKIRKEMEDEISKKNLTFFSNMVPDVTAESTKYNNYLVYSTFSCSLKYSIIMPIKIFWDANDFEIVKFTSRAEVSVSDTPEFIRNTDFVVDLLTGTKVGTTIKSVFDKINSFITKFK
ncbi:MAG: TadE/TadG family type IV pilus assembly protein [Acutalibacteraceae bacterium]